MATIGRKKDKFKFTEEFIQKALSRWYFSPNSVKYDIDGLYVFNDWESDKILETKSGYIYEFEIKVSRADFKNDFKHKKEKYDKFNLILEGKEDVLTPNYFSYACPENLISEEEIPSYAGLVYVTEGGTIKYIKSPTPLHKKKIQDAELNLTEKFYYNMVNWKKKAHDNHELLLEEVGLREERKKIPYAVLKAENEELKKKYESIFTAYTMANQNSKENHRYHMRFENQLWEKLREVCPDFDLQKFRKEFDDEFFGE